MVGMTPWGVFFLACKLPYTKCWLLCQQAHHETHFLLRIFSLWERHRFKNQRKNRRNLRFYLTFDII